VGIKCFGDDVISLDGTIVDVWMRVGAKILDDVFVKDGEHI
jgi:hypothetical protein